jgi:hypothetical protein
VELFDTFHAFEICDFVSLDDQIDFSSRLLQLAIFFFVSHLSILGPGLFADLPPLSSLTCTHYFYMCRLFAAPRALRPSGGHCPNIRSEQ